MNQLSQSWGLADNSPIRKVILVEAGAIAAYAALVGFDGVQLVAGALIGYLAAERSTDFLVEHGCEFMTRKWVIVAYYSAFVLGLTLMFRKKGHYSLLAVISPAFGGALLTSALAYSVTKLDVAGYMPWLPSVLPNLTPEEGSWVDFFLMLWSHEPKDVGLFANSSYNFQVSGVEYRLDRVISCGFWALFFLAGFFVQWRRIRKAKVSSASLQEPLLPASNK